MKNWPAAPYWTPPNGATVVSAGTGREALAGTSSPPLPFVAITPCRVVDTRGYGFTGEDGPPSMAGGASRNFTIGGQCGIPASAVAVSFNFTVWNTSSYGDFNIYPTGGVRPTVSTLNWGPGVLALANAAVVPLGTSGQITVVNESSGSVDIFADVNGYYSAVGVVTTLNTLSGDVTLAAGSNVTLTPSGQTLAIGAVSGGPPTGPAGGSLSGTYPNPGIASGAVGSAQLANGTAVRSINGAAQDLVTLQGSGAVSVSTAGSTITIGAPSGSMLLGAPGDTTLIGAGYTPVADTQIDYWTATTTTGAPSITYGHTAVWTGSRMIVWGQPTVGGRYDPVTNSWAPTNSTGAPSAREYHAAVWTGSKMIIWGGWDGAGSFFNDGGQYDPVADAWTATTTTGAPSGRYLFTSVWSGSKMIVWGGSDNVSFFDTGGRYDPVANSWQTTNTAGAPVGRAAHSATWTGASMIVWGGFDASTSFATGGRYDPVANSWTATSTTGAPIGRYSHTAVWTGSKVVVWGGTWSGFPGFLNDGGLYDPIANSWIAMTTAGAPSGRYNHTAVWNGAKMIVWGGDDSSSYFNTGGQYDPAANSWTATTTSGAPLPRSGHTAVWTGSRMIVWGGTNGGAPPDEGGQWMTLLLYRKN